MQNETWSCVICDFTVDQPGRYSGKGISEGKIMPGARSDAVAWYDDKAHELWLFGGDGIGSKFSGMIAPCLCILLHY